MHTRPFKEQLLHRRRPGALQNQPKKWVLAAGEYALPLLSPKYG
jgi:hypothetical protein